ncbi:GntR family transcriptional regulator [Microbacterium sp.]|uniref:GntR family transcriptional regulator n=1 Tax=Microbacterium sp. TaxID=51671 RepID=UPI0039E496FD
MPTKVDRGTETSADFTHSRLRDSILSGDLRPNQRLIEEELAAELGVSRTPVREALLRLRQEGLVVRRKGWTVRDHHPAEVLEFLEARGELEAVTARLAATRIDKATLKELEDLVEQMARTEDRQDVNTLNSRFHALIADASGNSLLARFTHGTDINYWSFSRPVLFSDADGAQVDADHRALLAALTAGDADEAERIARVHVARTARIVARSLGLSPRATP